MMRRRVAAWAVLAAAGLALAAAALIAWLNVRGEGPLDAAAPPSRDAAVIQRGAYLAVVGNCIACHTARGGAEYAGGRGVDTPFGTIYSANLTPDVATGIGGWSATEFYRALHHGRSKDGRLLYPAFPYPNFTLVTREDADAIFAFLHSLKPVQQANRAHDLRFPYNLQLSLAVWRALYFAPVTYRPDPAQTPEWNRGRYLVRGLGHCEACHAPRNIWGATSGDIELGGGLIPMQKWYAPSLASSREAGVAEWSEDEVVALLKTGISPRASVMGPMGEVVFRSTQHLSDGDLRAMAVFLKRLPQSETGIPEIVRAKKDVLGVGEKVYHDHCAACHGVHGEGLPAMFPPLVGNRAVALPSPNNVVKAILHGGFAPSTGGNPRPFGMPPYAHDLKDDEIAAVATFIRQSWGARASTVTTLDVLRAR